MKYKNVDSLKCQCCKMFIKEEGLRINVRYNNKYIGLFCSIECMLDSVNCSMSNIWKQKIKVKCGK